MEDLFVDLTPRRVLVLKRLLDGPARQEELRVWLEAQLGVPINPGEMTGLLKPLFLKRMVARRTPRGEVSVVHESLLRQFLIAANDLAGAMASEAQMAAGRAARVAEKTDRALRQGSLREGQSDEVS